MVLWFKFFLSLSNITHLFPLHVRISSTDLKFLQGFRKLDVFSLLLTKFSIFLKSTCLFLAIFLKFILIQKKSVVSFSLKHSIFYFKTLQIFIQKKREITFNFRKIFVKQTWTWTFSHELSRNTYLKEYLWIPGSIISIKRLCKNVKIPHSKII